MLLGASWLWLSVRVSFAVLLQRDLLGVLHVVETLVLGALLVLVQLVELRGVQLGVISNPHLGVVCEQAVAARARRARSLLRGEALRREVALLHGNEQLAIGAVWRKLHVGSTFP